MKLNYRNSIFRKKCSFGILLQMVQGNLKCISGVSKRSDTKESTQFRVIMEHEEFFFCFSPFVNAKELLEVTTKLPIKLNYPVINVVT
jgi:hypothetical protein